MAPAQTIEPQFLNFEDRRLFTLRFPPQGETKGAILYIPPFGEEMNRCRALVADQARALAARGLDCLLLDPTGTGDSSGNLADATWAIWQEDIAFAADWLERKSGHPVTLWGCRLGALQAAELASRNPGRFPRLLFWQPIADGALFLNQQIRLLTASTIVQEKTTLTTQQIKQRLAEGDVIEIAGYPLSGRLAEGFKQHALTNMAGLSKSPISWVEMVSEGAQLPMASQRTADKLRESGCRIDTCAVEAPFMWQIQERDSAPGLIRATLSILCGDD